MRVAGLGVTDVGRNRKRNEDFLLVDPALGLYVVCDGMGGAEAGDVAARLAATAVQRVMAEARPRLVDEAGSPVPQRIAAALRTAIETACQEVFDEGSSDIAKRGMGCTCTAVMVAQGKAVLGHVGDSRLYLHRGGTVTQLSEDHSFVAEAVKQGIFTAEEAAMFAYKNILTRAIGKERTVIADTLVFDLVIGDTLLLCSDGLHGYFSDPAELAQHLGAPDLERIPKVLIAIANDRGGSDNITAVVVRGEAQGADGDAVRRTNTVLRGLETLQKIDLLSDLSMAEIVRFNQVFTPCEFAPGQPVIRQGEVNSTLFVLVEGSAEVLRDEARIAVLKAGTHFGEMSLLSSRPRSATVRALEPCSMLGVARDRLYEFLQQDGMLAAKFFWKLAATLSVRLEEVLQQQREPQGGPTARLYAMRGAKEQ